MDFTSVDEGPALIYPYDPDARRLDAILDADPRLSSQVALRIIKGIAEAVKHAHDQEVTHGGLSPRAVFVTPGKEPVVRVADWLTASASTETGTPFRKVLAGTEHPTTLLAEDMQPYRAPETLTSRNFDGKRADMFSLGAIAYRLLGGEFPSDLAQLHTQLARDQGLRLDESTVSTDLCELVFHATRPRSPTGSTTPWIFCTSAPGPTPPMPGPEPNWRTAGKWSAGWDRVAAPMRCLSPT